MLRLHDVDAVYLGGTRVNRLKLGSQEIALPTLKRGNFQSYANSLYTAYSGMWGVYRARALEFDVAMRIYPPSFPSHTSFAWDVTPDPDWSGVNGYLHVAYGNYDWSPGTITSRRVRSISDLTVDLAWTYEGDEASGLLCECWLSDEGVQGAPFTKLCEIGFLPKLSPASASFTGTLTRVGSGSFRDSNGIRWIVGMGESGAGPDVPYIVAHRPGYEEFEGSFLFHEYFAFLVYSGVITGDEWFNGIAFGVEPLSGSARLTVDKFAPSYSGS